jgi:hypothetical protein
LVVLVGETLRDELLDATGDQAKLPPETLVVAVKVADCPAQIVWLLTETVGSGFTVMVTATGAEGHPEPPTTGVTISCPFAAGEAPPPTIEEALVAPLTK